MTPRADHACNNTNGSSTYNVSIIAQNMVSCLACGVSDKARKAGITFHRFPKNPKLYAAWLMFVNKTEETMPKIAALCSQHFEVSEFDKSSFKVMLSRTAVPSIEVKRHRYDKIKSSAQPVPIPAASSSGIPSSGKQTEAVDPLDICHVSIVEPQVLETSELPKIIQIKSTAGDTPKTAELQQQISRLAMINVRQAKQIRQLQKKTWFQKKRIAQLTAVVKELRAKR
ncbi:THAP domain-containing protein 1 A-like [Photinus pyralis]|uniref:THAP domain-containing protein 1 A-like n=1 Tax=Photinus pyralis TaxID=7054 RepID=UPI0012671982|nr:THAP domain-containing protein 1 A-like [Photinus pyralis]